MYCWPYVRLQCGTCGLQDVVIEFAQEDRGAMESAACYVTYNLNVCYNSVEFIAEDVQEGNVGDIGEELV